MKVINEELFAINPSTAWDVQKKHIGHHKNRIIIIGNFFKNPYDVKLFAQSTEYASTLNGEYTNLPGYIHNIGIFRKILYYPYSYICKHFFEGSSEVMKVPDHCRFTFQVYDVKEKCRFSSLYPHTDNMRYASVLSLNDEDDYDGDTNGTAFYRSVETGEEYISYDKNYRAARLQNATQALVNFDPSKVKYKEWERYHLEQQKFNSLIVYEGNLWHSLYFEQEKWNTNRLTFNGFIR